MKKKVDTESATYNHGDDGRFQELLELTSSLRKQQEDEALLFDRGHEQRRELNESSKYLQRLLAKRNDLDSILSGSGDIVDGLQQKIADSRLVLGKLDEEYSESHQLLNEAISILNGDEISELDVNDLEQTVAVLTADVEDLEKQRDSLLSAMDSKLGFYKKRAMGVAKKKETATVRLNECKREVRDLRSEKCKWSIR